jgi:hypothetical protein
MKLLHNKTNDLYLNLENMVTVQVTELTKELNKVYGIVVCLSTHSPTPVVFFSDKEKARKCLKDIILFRTEELVFGDTLEVEDDVKESILVAPDSVKNKSFKMSK